MDVSQESLIEIDFAFRCRADCSTVNETQLLVRPIFYNRIINPQETEGYVTQFLEKKRYYGITTRRWDFDIALSYYMSTYEITNDNSIMPWESTETEQGIFIPQQPGLSYYPNPYNSFVFVRVTVQMSNRGYYYTRRFQKIFDAISLVGGLIPIFMIGFIWLYYYALAHFEMTFLKKLHSDQKAK